MILNNIFRPRASGTANPDNWLVDWFRGGNVADSGVPVDQDSALKSGPFYQAVMIIPGDVSQLPLRLMTRDGSDNTERDRKHAGHKLWSQQPNNEMVPGELKELLQLWVFLWGNGIAHIDRRGSEPVQLIPLLPDRTEIERGPDGQLWYITRIESTQTVHRIRPENILHIKGRGGNGSWGRSIIDVAKNPIGLDLTLLKHGGHVFKNGARPGGVLQRPIEAGALSDAARKTLRREWNETQEGLDNGKDGGIARRHDISAALDE